MVTSLMQPSSLGSLQTGALVGQSWLVVGCDQKRRDVGWSFGLKSGFGESSGKRTASCRATGGTRRDEAKLVARTQKRRSRHVKGVTPTKPELFDELQAEEEADLLLGDFHPQNDLESEPDTSDDSEEISDLPSRGEESGLQEEETVRVPNGKPNKRKEGEEVIIELLGKPILKAELGSTSNGTPEGNDGSPCEDVIHVENERWDQGTSTGDSGVEEIIDSGDNTFTVKYFPDGKPSQAARAEKTVSDVTRTVEETAEAVATDVRRGGESIQEDAEEVVQQVGEVVGEVSDIAQDTAKDVTETAQEAVDVTRKNLSEAGDVVRENVEEGAEQFGEIAAEVSEITQDTAKEVVITAQETFEEVGKSLGEAGEAVLESLEEIASQGQKLAREGADALGEELQEGQRETQENLSEFGNQALESGDRTARRTEKALEKITGEAGKSLQAVQDSVAALMEGSVSAAGTIGSEALRLGEVVLSAAGEVVGFTPENVPEAESSSTESEGKELESSRSSGRGVRQVVKERTETADSKPEETSQEIVKPEKQAIQSRREKITQPEESAQEDENPFKGLRVTVAGASGRTGRFLVEELVRKGVPVRALVRNKSKPEVYELEKLSNVEVVEADLYKYETIKKALGDSNVVISAIGARSFPFDPIGTYQAEFEGVKNLVAAAKNKGDVKKFVFVTSLGVTFLQIVPLIFWKKQSELYLQRSGLDYTIVRPGGLTNGTDTREIALFKAPDTQFGGAISRKKVAEICVAALVTPEASEKIVEVVSGGGVVRSFSELFGSI